MDWWLLSMWRAGDPGLPVLAGIAVFFWSSGLCWISHRQTHYSEQTQEFTTNILYSAAGPANVFGSQSWIDRPHSLTCGYLPHSMTFTTDHQQKPSTFIWKPLPSSEKKAECSATLVRKNYKISKVIVQHIKKEEMASDLPYPPRQRR